ncbi:hypothetical protein BH23PLA1_BH23PLA1_00170 [soil metagenome]
MPRLFPPTRRHLRTRGHLAPNRHAARSASAWWTGLLGLALAFGAAGPEAGGQEGVRVNPDDPRLVVSPGGHTAPVRSLIFTEAADGGRLLLSAGFDKVIHVWNLDDGRPRLVRTLRPPIFRGPAGSIYAMALTPQADAQNQRLLAVGGYGVRSSRGTITLFRFPGTKDLETGDVADVLEEGYPDLQNQKIPQGHTDTVTCLAFDPSGTVLVSASLDGTVRLWDVARRQTTAVLQGDRHLRELPQLRELNRVLSPLPPIQPQGLALISDGQRLRLVVGDAGSMNDPGVMIRLWDITQPAQPVLLGRTAVPVPAGLEDTWINALAISPDGRLVVVGQENGLLTRFDLTDRGLANPVHLATHPQQGPIEALAFTQDKQGPLRLVTSILSRRPAPTERPVVDCDIEVWDLSGGRTDQKVSVARTNNLVHVCAFTTDDRLVVFSGGDAQGLYFHDPAGRPVAALEGRGRSLWDVGFAPDSQGLGFSRLRPDHPHAPQTYEGLDFLGVGATNYRRAELHRAIPSMGGWRIEPINRLELKVVIPGGLGGRILLDEKKDRRWWDYSFLPDGKGGYRPVVTVACEGGVLFFKIRNDGEPCRRLRHFSGHNGPTYTLAPSPDGRWLATGSADQTIGLWSLEGCETRPPLGAELELYQPPGQERPWFKVNTVMPSGFAAEMGLQAGDYITDWKIDLSKLDRPIQHFKEVPWAFDNLEPNQRVEVQIHRRNSQTKVWFRPGPEMFDGWVGTSKRDNPALTLFADHGGEWVAWMPQGYYETSAKGDREYLGWHRNRIALAGATDFAPADAYEATFRQPAVLATLIRTADPLAALRAAARPAEVALDPAPAPPQVMDPPPIVETPRPPPLPVVQITTPAGVSPDAPLVTDGAVLRLAVQATAGPALEFGTPGRPIQSLEVKLDNWTFQSISPEDAKPVVRLSHELDVPLRPGRQFLSVSAVDDLGRGAERPVGFEVIYNPPQPDPEPQGPRLWVLSIGAERFAEPGLEIDFAGNDARAVADFLLRPGGRERFPYRERFVLDGLAEPAHPAAIGQQFERLGALGNPEAAGDGLVRDDTVFVFLESHLLDLEGPGLALLGANGAPGDEAATIPADRITETLGQLADYGCKVVLLLDVVHETSPVSGARSAALQGWIRQLCYERGVIVFTASSSGPGRRAGLAGQHGAFALGLIESFRRSPTRLRDDPDAPWTLDDFQEALAANVASYTQDRAQRIGYYKPWTYKGTTLFFDPPDSSPAGPLAADHAGE